MSNVKTVIIRRDSNGNMTNRVMTTPKSVNVMQEGLRASDNMTMTLSAEHDVQVGDEIYYIQDYIDTTSLKALWNFYGGFRDESGYEHDDVYTVPYTMPTCVDALRVSETEIDWKHKGYYKFLINSLSDSAVGIEITKRYKNNNVNADGSPKSGAIPVIDMSGDFDMIFEFKMLSNSSDSRYTSQTIFDNYSYDVSKGLKVQINPSANTVIVKADTTTMTTSSVVSYGVDSNGVPNVISFLRVKRENGVFKVYFNGALKSTNTTSTGNLNHNKNIHLFKEYNETGDTSTPPMSAYLDDTGFYGIPIQYRFYTGILGDDEVAKLKASKPVNTTMKFGGKIWKIDDKGSVKKLTCSSHSKQLLNINVSSHTFNSQATETIGSSPQTSSRKHNIYYQTDLSNSQTKPQMEDIVQNILKYIDDGVYAYFPDEPGTTLYGDFIAEGTFLDIMKVLMVLDTTDHMFVITPRKILFINDEVSTNHVINNDKYDIKDTGKDDTGTTNSMFTSGKKKMYTASGQTSSFSFSQHSWSAQTGHTFAVLSNGSYYNPVIERIISVKKDNTLIYALESGATTGNESSSTYATDTYKMHPDNTISFWNQNDSSAHVWKVEYEYSYLYNKSATDNSSLFWASTQHAQNQPSIDDIGIYHRNFYVPQLTHGYDVYFFNVRYLADNKLINTRYRAVTSSLVNSLTVGQKVRYTDSEGTTTDKMVRSIEYAYPQTVTVIELGEYMFSGFDVEKQVVETIRSLDQGMGVARY